MPKLNDYVFFVGQVNQETMQPTCHGIMAVVASNVVVATKRAEHRLKLLNKRASILLRPYRKFTVIDVKKL